MRTDAPTPPPAAARQAGLVYVSDAAPGIRRRRRGGHFTYQGPDGRTIRDPEALARIRSLAVPPAWTDVWICERPDGHLQATGRDARGRKQYRYHPRWREVRDADKYGRLVAFGRVLPRIRERVDQDLRRPSLCRQRVLATIVRLLETTLIRVGNEEYARENHSYGLTTLEERHVSVEGSTVRFVFRGKSGREHEVDLHDQRVARVVRRLEELPGRELFQYVAPDGRRQKVDSGDVNDYLRDAGGDDFTAKDFRTWAGTVLAARALQGLQGFGSKAEAKRNAALAVEAVAGTLGNTTTVCRRCYVHPAVLDAYLEGSLPGDLRLPTPGQRAGGLRPEEAALLSFLEDRLGDQL